MLHLRTWQPPRSEYRDADGHVFDFHALRHQYITNLARSGVHPKGCPAARPPLDHRAHNGVLHPPRLANTVGAVESLPEPVKPQSTTLRATGTDDQPVQGGGRVAVRRHRRAEKRPVSKARSDEQLIAKKTKTPAIAGVSEAEGTRLELATPCGAPHFQSVDSIEAPSSLADASIDEPTGYGDGDGDRASGGGGKVAVQLAANEHDSPPSPPIVDRQLERLNAAWPTFSVAKRAAILALVEAPIG